MSNKEIENIEKVSGGFTRKEKGYSFKRGDIFCTQLYLKYVVDEDTETINDDDLVPVEVFGINPANQKETSIEHKKVTVKQLLKL